jgi:hypothetical protein
MVLVGLVSVAWYSERTDSGVISITADYGLSKIRVNTGFATIEGDYDDVKAELGWGTTSEVISKAETTRTILSIGILALIAFIGLALARAMDKVEDSGHKAATAMGFVSAGLILLAVIYFGASISGAIEADGGTSDSGSLGGSWWLVLFAGLLTLLAAELTRRAPTVYEAMYPDGYGYGYGYEY